MNLAIPFLLLTILAGSAQDARTKEKPALDKEFKIKIGQQVTIKNLTIKFSALQNESRCPTGVQCIWEGNAAIVIEVSKKNQKSVQATLNTNTAIQPNQLSYKGFKVGLFALSPHPRINQTNDEKDYEATLIVTKE
ncbi:MAG: hypothetical protein AABO41_07140 [Acidobacteriota bacterium]